MDYDYTINVVDNINRQKEDYLTKSSRNAHLIDDDLDTEDPIVSAFIEKGNDAVLTMTNLNIGEFMEIYADVEKEIKIVRRGPKAKISPKDCLFLTLVMLKGYFKWDVMANLFGLKTSLLEKTIKTTLERIYPSLLNKYIQDIPKNEQDLQQIRFFNFPDCIEVIDVCFQPIQKPSGSFRSKKVFFSGKHFAYGVKIECTHAPDGRLMRFTSHYPGSVHDFKILTENIQPHLDYLKNGDSYYGALADLGYIGIKKFIPTAIIPKKTPILSEDIDWNYRVSSDRVICENYYGRNKALWSILSQTFRWDLDDYDMIFGVCSALTNYLLKTHPLRNQECDIYRGLLVDLKTQEQETARKKMLTRKRQRRNRNSRISNT